MYALCDLVLNPVGVPPLTGKEIEPTIECTLAILPLVLLLFAESFCPAAGDLMNGFWH